MTSRLGTSCYPTSITVLHFRRRWKSSNIGRMDPTGWMKTRFGCCPVTKRDYLRPLDRRLTWNWFVLRDQSPKYRFQLTDRREPPQLSFRPERAPAKAKSLAFPPTQVVSQSDRPR